ncbi:MAG: PPC domain-containing protein [Thermoplasmatota archaeon]
MRWLLIFCVLSLAGCLDSDPAPPQDGTPNQTQEPFNGTATIEAAGTIPVGTQGVDSCGGLLPVDSQIFLWTLPETVENLTASYHDMEVVLTITSQGSDLDLYVSGPSGDAESVDFNIASGSQTETILFTGTVQPGDYTISVVGCVAALATYELAGSVEFSAI